MKKSRKIFAITLIVGMLGATGFAYAATSQTPAEVLVEQTGKTLEEINEERASGKTFGAIADEAGQLEEFKVAMLEQKKALLDERVADGTLTREQADEIYNNIVNNQLLCDGTGNGGNGLNGGLGGNGLGCGQGAGKGNGMGNGMRNGRGRN